MKRTKYPQAELLRNMGLVQKIAWSFHLSTGLEVQDLISEGYLTYLEMLKKWDPERGAHTTFMWFCVRVGLQAYLTQQRKHYAIDITEIKFPIQKKEYSEDLTEDANFICNLILKDPQAFITYSKDEIHRRIKFALLNRGWGLNRINKNLQELKVKFS